MLKFQRRLTKRSLEPGGGEGIRTPDPRVANAVLCQLSYTPDKKVVAGAGFEPATFGL